MAGCPLRCKVVVLRRLPIILENPLTVRVRAGSDTVSEPDGTAAGGPAANAGSTDAADEFVAAASGERSGASAGKSAAGTG